MGKASPRRVVDAARRRRGSLAFREAFNLSHDQLWLSNFEHPIRSHVLQHLRPAAGPPNLDLVHPCRREAEVNTVVARRGIAHGTSHMIDLTADADRCADAVVVALAAGQFQMEPVSRSGAHVLPQFRPCTEC